jgi:hypothetical protein
MSQTIYDQWKREWYKQELKDTNEAITLFEGIYKQYWHKTEMGRLTREILEALYKERNEYESELNAVNKTASRVIRWFKTGLAFAKDEAGSANFAFSA